jgi:RNA polymerase sigma-70 factor, ECF subfamily
VKAILEDLDIIIRTRQDPKAFELVLRKYHRHVLNFIFQIVPDESIVEDLGQEVFINVYRSLSNFDEKRGVPFGAWLFAIARNRAISELRRRKFNPPLPLADHDQFPDNGPGPDEILLGKEKLAAIEEALEQLEEPFKSALVASIRGASLKEIARDCSLPLNTVKTRVFRAREKLRILLRIREG